MYLGYGGQACQHGASQTKVWKNTVNFLRTSVIEANSIPMKSKI